MPAPTAGDRDLTTGRGLTLPAAALDETFARGSGPGGQHRNVTASAVELVADLNALTGPGASRARAVLGEEVRVRADDSRSQWRNRTIARARLADLIDEAAVPVTPRRPTRPSRRARQARLDDKRRAGERKRDRGWRPGDES
jgi:ribosome-associated protein